MRTRTEIYEVFISGETDFRVLISACDSTQAGYLVQMLHLCDKIPVNKVNEFYPVEIECYGSIDDKDIKRSIYDIPMYDISYKDIKVGDYVYYKRRSEMYKVIAYKNNKVNALLMINETLNTVFGLNDTFYATEKENLRFFRKSSTVGSIGEDISVKKLKEDSLLRALRRCAGFFKTTDRNEYPVEWQEVCDKWNSLCYKNEKITDEVKKEYQL